MKRYIFIFFALVSIKLEAQKKCFTQGNVDDFANYKIENNRQLEEDIIIPVVVHILHNEPTGAVQGTNISIAQINSQIDRLNEDFGGFNPELQNIPIEFQDIVAYNGIGIQFKLAELDPDGNPTNGITRTYTTKTDFNVELNDAKRTVLGGKDGWPRSYYLNIWVVPSLFAYSGSVQIPVLGQATFPDVNLEEYYDGIVMWHYNFGDNTGTSVPANTDYYKGRTLVHELGHYFSLKHIWGDDIGCSTDDGIIDTPTQEQAYQECQTSVPFSCGSPDMFINYMDYSPDECLNAFTEGQKQRVEEVLNSHPTRVDLLNAWQYAFINCTAQAGNVLSPQSFDVCNDTYTEPLYVFGDNEDYELIWVICKPNGEMIELTNDNQIDFDGFTPGYYGVSVINIIEWEVESIEVFFEQSAWTLSEFSDAIAEAGFCADVQKFGYPIFTVNDCNVSNDIDFLDGFVVSNFQNGFAINSNNYIESIVLFSINGEMIDNQNNVGFEYSNFGIYQGIYIVNMKLKSGKILSQRIFIK